MRLKKLQAVGIEPKNYFEFNFMYVINKGHNHI